MLEPLLSKGSLLVSYRPVHVTMKIYGDDIEDEVANIGLRPVTLHKLTVEISGESNLKCFVRILKKFLIITESLEIIVCQS